MTGTAGNKDDSARSDCFVKVTLTKKQGIEIDLKSKVEALYGKAIRKLCLDILNFFEIKNAKVEIDDKGALDFVIAARLESAIREVVNTDKEYLLPQNDKNNYVTGRKAARRSRLYLPGNSPKLMLNAGIYSADGIILDLEDSVAPDKKNEARLLVRNALRSVDFYGAERMVRINQVPQGLNDLKYIVTHNVNLILIPKCETPDHVRQVDKKISEITNKPGHGIHLMPIIESALGVINAYLIATASENIVAMAIGMEDYTADIGAQRTDEGRESFYARSVIVNACAAAGIQAIDSVYSDTADMEGLKKNVAGSKALGFAGMGCIHPRQVAVVNSGYNPGKEEIEKAKAIVLAFDEAQSKGSGVVAVNSKMIDLPVVKRALTTIENAVRNGLLKKNWKEGKRDE